MGLTPLEGQLPVTMAQRMTPLQARAPQDVSLSLVLAWWGARGEEALRLHRSACSPPYFLLMRISGAVWAMKPQRCSAANP